MPTTDRAAVELFDPRTEAPPPDALDFVLYANYSVSIYATAAREMGQDDVWRAVAAANGAALDAAMTELQRSGGYVRDGEHRHRAQLAATGVVHWQVPGRNDWLRLHNHVYLGRRARTDMGDVLPVEIDSDQFTKAVTFLGACYEDIMGEQLNVHLNPLGEHLRWVRAGREQRPTINQQHVLQFADDWEHVSCTGEWPAAVHHDVVKNNEWLPDRACRRFDR